MGFAVENGMVRKGSADTAENRCEDFMSRLWIEDDIPIFNATLRHFISGRQRQQSYSYKKV